MKKSILIASLLMLAGNAAFAAAPVYKWHKLIDSKSTQDQIADVAVTSDGNLVSMSGWGSKETTDALTFDGENIAIGAQTSANSDNKNLVIIKHNAADGSKVWAVSSTCGDISTTDGGVVATPDGGVLALLKLRGSQVSPDFNRPSLIDAVGNTVDLDNFNNSVWAYNMTLVKISANGAIEWARNILQDQTEIPGYGKETTNAVTPSTVAADAEGNLYIGGNYRSPMVLMGKNNSVHVLTPRTIEGYSGDPQASVGGFFIVKLDKDGDYVGHIDSSSTGSFDQVNALAVDGGMLYFAGRAKGAADATLTVGGKSAVFANANITVFYGAADTSLAVSYVKIAVSNEEGRKPALFVESVDPIDGKLYITGRFVGGIGAEGTTSSLVKSSSAMQEAYALKINASDGAMESATAYGSTISNYYMAFKDSDNNICLFGYRLNAADGVLLSKWNGTDAKPAETDRLITGGGAPTTSGCAYDAANKVLYATARGNNAFTIGDTTSEKPQGWGGIIAAYSLGNVAAEATGVSMAAPSYIGGKASLTVTAPEAMPLAVVNAEGMTVYSAEMEAGTTTIALAPGVYVANGVKILVR